MSDNQNMTEPAHCKPEMNLQPIDYAVKACETMMRRYAPEDLPPRGHFHYHQGVFLSGMLKTWRLTGDNRYFTYAKNWIDSVFDKEGHILDYAHADLDDIMPGILLFPILDQTSDSYYKKCIASVWQEVLDIPKNRFGGYYHKVNCVEQMWLDGLYMCGPFLAEYARRCHLPEYTEESVRQVLLMKEKTCDPKTGLWYHAYDASGKAGWADPVTLHSPEFWGRSIGWVPVAVLDDMEQMDPAEDGYQKLAAAVTELLTAVCRYQGPDGRWYQVVDQPGKAGNWPENSCSCLFVSAIARAVRKGLLPASFQNAARRGYEGVIRDLNVTPADPKTGESDLLIGNVCIGTGVGDYDFYCARPVCINDLHGVGAFLLMCTAMQEL